MTALRNTAFLICGHLEGDNARRLRSHG